MHAGHEFAGAEGLGDVIVGAEAEAFELVGLGGAGGQHDDGDVAGGAQAAADFGAVEQGEHAVEDDEIGRGGAAEFEGGDAVGGEAGFEAVVFQVELDGLGGARIVFDDEDAGHEQNRSMG